MAAGTGVPTREQVPPARAAAASHRLGSRSRSVSAVPPREVRVKVCVVGAGAIGSLFAAHLAKVAEVSVLTRRDDHARALNEQGLRVSGRADFTASVMASADPSALPEPELVVVACKGSDLDALTERLAGHFAEATLMTVQ